MVLMLALSVLLWWVAITRAHRWVQSRSVFTLGTTIVFVCMAAHTTVNLQWVDRFVSDATGVPNSTSAVKHVIFLGICLGAALMIVALRVPRVDAQRRWVAPLSIGALVSAVAAVVLFFSANAVPQAESGYQFDELYAHLPGYAEAAALVMGVAAVLCTIVTVVVLLGWDVSTPAGRGLAILTPGVAILSAYAWMRAGYIVAARSGWIEPSTTVFDLSSKLAVIGILLTTLGLMWASIEGAFAVRVQRRDFAELHDALVDGRWPGVARDSQASASAARRVEDRASEVLDALSMQARRDGLPEQGDEKVSPEMIARWLRTGEAGGVSVSDLRPPADTESVRWVRSVGKAFSTTSGIDPEATRA